MSRGTHLTEEEIEFVKVNCMVMETADIAKALGRNYWTIHRFLQKIGYVTAHRFTKEEDTVIRMMYPTNKIRKIATVLGVDENAVYNRARKLGIKKRGVAK